LAPSLETHGAWVVHEVVVKTTDNAGNAQSARAVTTGVGNILETLVSKQRNEIVMRLTAPRTIVYAFSDPRSFTSTWWLSPCIFMLTFKDKLAKYC
jgi:transposase-like protein